MYVVYDELDSRLKKFRKDCKTPKAKNICHLTLYRELESCCVGLSKARGGTAGPCTLTWEEPGRLGRVPRWPMRQG